MAADGYVSRRGARIGRYQGILSQGFTMYGKDRFDERSNPQGVLNLGTSENKLCFDLIEEWFNRHNGGSNIAPHMFQYSDVQGIESFRHEIAKFLTDYARAPKALNPEHIVVMNGCCSIFAALSAVLFDPGDCYLIPTPYFGGVNPDMWLYGEVQAVHVPLDSKMSDGESFPFQLSVKKLEAAMQKANEQGIRIRALILINPHNPLGDIYPEQLLKDCLDFAHRHKLHVIMDEIYMLSVYDDINFTSVLSLNQPDPERIHFMWGFSKDFAMCGIRVAILHTRNKEVRSALNQLASFHGCPVPIQFVLSQLIADREWIDKIFLPTSRQRLREAHQIIVDGLAALGIPVFRSSAGLFVWADFRKFLRTQTSEAEMELWWKLIDGKLYISPGIAFDCCEPGWFRLVFSDSADRIRLGIQRLKVMLQAYASETIPLDNLNEVVPYVDPVRMHSDCDFSDNTL
ncbi:1-aminocyclopropane-1-carboxylate synthase-like protein 1 isoform X2 [Scyliorhinus canicula]|uniref:1-aminocyclopropane-1-carboxylate synthase-like protein 1 isoform X2 n=1 Tax=Scyliorhinus canicula TaxID=7830 RepID=UPI0018F5FAF5|nr:1-aminocyclopropane-1-carboxylate synthase-like protein 1 isoform X2 [Scyliorhinus canicula]